MKDEIVLENLIVVKRSGQRVNFNGTKIAIAIKSAFDSVNNNDINAINKIYENVLLNIISNYKNRKTINVEDIQDMIETELKNEKHNEVFTSFNNYRNKRKASREIYQDKEQHKFAKTIEAIESNLELNRNNYPIDTINYCGEIISSEFTKSHILDSKPLRLHEEGCIYIHDLKYYSLGLTSSSHLNLNEIKNLKINEYINLILKIISNIKKEQYGEHTISSIDYMLEPIIILEFKKIYQTKILEYLSLYNFLEYIGEKAIKEIISNINTIYFDPLKNNQLATNIQIKNIFYMAYNSSLQETEKMLKQGINRLLLDLNDLDSLNSKKIAISIGTNESKEGTLINNTYLNIIKELDYLDNVATIFKVTKKSSYLDQVVRLLVLDKNINLNFVESSINKKYKSDVEYFTNGKRIIDNIYEDKIQSLGRMNLFETSIDLPRIAFRSRNSLEEFYKNLDEVLEIVKNQLLQRFDIASNKYISNYKYLFSYNVILDNDKIDPSQRIRKLLKNNVLNIGLVGIYECAIALDAKNKTKIILNILNYINNKCKMFSKEENLNFICSETSDDKVLQQLLNIDKSIYGTQNESLSNKKYNSIYDNLINDKYGEEKSFELLSKYQELLLGGTYIKLILPNKISYKKILELIFLLDQYNIGYVKIEVGKKS